MSIQDDFQHGVNEYARQLDARKEADRLAALKLEARHDGNAQLFADAVEAELSRTREPDTDE